jgi:hypothetical protein
MVERHSFRPQPEISRTALAAGFVENRETGGIGTRLIEGETHRE